MDNYVLGHSAAELRRLTTQAEFLRPITKRMLDEAGLRRGMRVIDLGCGAGDVSLLVAELIGTEGSVLGIDQSSAAIAFASARMAEAGVHNAVFRHATERDLFGEAPFDAAVGRYILCYQSDPSAFIRDVAQHVHPGGIVAFHEFDPIRTQPELPAIPLFDQVWGEMISALCRTAASPGVSRRLAACFAEAGLSVPRGFCERTVGMAGDSLFFRWVAGSYLAVRTERAEGEREEADRLAAELDAAVAAVHGQVVADDQWCAWATVRSADV